MTFDNDARKATISVWLWEKMKDQPCESAKVVAVKNLPNIAFDTSDNEFVCPVKVLAHPVCLRGITFSRA